MTKKQINNKAKRYLALKAEQKKIKEEMDEIMNEVITPFANSVVHEFRANKYLLDDAVIKLKANPPKLLKKNGEALSSDERAKLCKSLPKEYVSLSPAVSLMNEHFGNDQVLKVALESKQIVVGQDSRYDLAAA